MIEDDLYPMVGGGVDIDMQTMAPNLSETERRQLCDLLQEFAPVMQLTPGRTTIAEHEIYVGDTMHPHSTTAIPDSLLPQGNIEGRGGEDAGCPGNSTFHQSLGFPYCPGAEKGWGSPILC